MPSVHYKFKSFLDYKTLVFEGIQISVGELKRLIYENEKIGKSADYDLQISNAQTKQIYEDETTPIQRNTSVVVARVPAAVHQKLPKVWDTRNEGKVIRTTTVFQPSRSVASMLPEKNDLASKSDLTEDEKLKLMQQEATQDYDPLHYQRGRHLVSSGPAPATLKCNKCGQNGHWLKDCPLLNVRRPTGIPKDELMETTPDDPQAMLTPSGRYVVPIMDKQAHLIGKKERPPFFDDETPVLEPKPKKEIPSELTCALCNDMLRDAVVIRCCGYSFCDECIRNRLLESDYHQCPQCGEKNISPDTLVPNSQLRKAVSNYRNETGYVYAKQQRIDAAHGQQSSGMLPTTSTSSKLKINLVSASAARSSLTPEQRFRSAIGNTDASSSPLHHEMTASTQSPDLRDRDSPAVAIAATTSSSDTVAPSALVTTSFIPQRSSFPKPVFQSANVSAMKMVPSSGPPAWLSVSLAAPSMHSAPLSAYMHGLHPVGVPIIAAPPASCYPHQQHALHPQQIPPPPGVVPSPASSYLSHGSSFVASQPPPPGVPGAVPVVPVAPLVTSTYITRPPFGAPRRPLTEEEFYDAKRRMLETRFRERYRSPRPQDAWEEFLARKDRKRRSSSKSSRRSSRSRSRTRSSSRSRRSRSRSSARSRSRSRSRPRTHGSSHVRVRRRDRSPRDYHSRTRRQRSPARPRRTQSRHYHRRDRRSRSRSKERTRTRVSRKSPKLSPPKITPSVRPSSNQKSAPPVESQPHVSPTPPATTTEKKTVLASCVGYAAAAQPASSPPASSPPASSDQAPAENDENNDSAREKSKKAKKPKVKKAKSKKSKKTKSRKKEKEKDKEKEKEKYKAKEKERDKGKNKDEDKNKDKDKVKAEKPKKVKKKHDDSSVHEQQPDKN